MFSKNNSSVLPSVLFKRTENIVFSNNFGLDDIAKIIQKLDANKSYGHIWSLSACLKYAVTLSTNHSS